jgi:N-methylhydantoinase A
MMHVGVDIGGTFTDLVLSVDGRLKIHKLLSTPKNPAQAMLAGLQAIAAAHGGLEAVARASHGSTVATNAILERKGARTALITTQGFRDILAIGRQNRPVLYALQPQLPPPLIPRELCYEVPERLDFNGTVITPLDTSALDAVLDDISLQDVDAVAVCFLYSYVNPLHEQAVRARIVELGFLEEWQVVLSCEVLPEFREYERASTVALEAYVRPVMSRYISKLESELPESTALRIMKSDGGVISAGRIKQQAIQTALSGPAAGVIGAFHIAQMAGFDHIITLDIGGTSTDVALLPGEVIRRPQSEIDRLPLRVRLLDIETIGAGGGSIARLDAGGALRVGPESAGADPGPILYGRGGTQVTVSDANAVLGRLDADHFLGGTMTLNIGAAHEAVEALGRQMGLGVEEAAAGIIDVANVNIDRALRRVSIARGYDPRDFTLVAFGGAGPLHACEVADRLEIPRVLVPRYPGVLCAFGLLVADVALDYSRSVLGEVTIESTANLYRLLEEMTEQARRDLAREGFGEDSMMFRATLDMRYKGQAYELTVPFGTDLVTDFHEAHRRTYGHAMEKRAVEAVNLRVQAVGIVEKPALKPEPHAHGNPSALGYKPGTIRSNGVPVMLYDRETLGIDHRFAGPALVFQMDSTVYLAAGWSARVDGYRNLIMERTERLKAQSHIDRDTAFI